VRDATQWYDPKPEGQSSAGRITGVPRAVSIALTTAIMRHVKERAILVAILKIRVGLRQRSSPLEYKQEQRTAKRTE